MQIGCQMLQVVVKVLKVVLLLMMMMMTTMILDSQPHRKAEKGRS
jgi:hypothetical protein